MNMPALVVRALLYYIETAGRNIENDGLIIGRI